MHYELACLSEKSWINSDLQEATKGAVNLLKSFLCLLLAFSDLTVEKLEVFIPQLMSMLHVECLVHGNMDKESALNLVNLVEKKLAGNSLPLLPPHLLRYRDMRLEDGIFCLITPFYPIL